MANSTLQRLLDAGVQFGEMSRKQAESVVRQLVKAGEVQRGDAEKLIGGLVERGKDTSERLSEVIQREVSKQVTWMSERFDELEDRFEDLAESVAARVGDAPMLLVAVAEHRFGRISTVDIGLVHRGDALRKTGVVIAD